VWVCPFLLLYGDKWIYYSQIQVTVTYVVKMYISVKGCNQHTFFS
jgi:hypothetical protein